MAILTKKQQLNFVLALPVINVIADSTQDYFQPGILSPGYIRASVILLFIITHFRYFYRVFPINNTIMILVAYLFILGFLSSKILLTQNIYLKFLISSMMFPIGYYYFNNLERFRKLLKVLAWTLGIYVLFLLISSIFKLGTSNYLVDSAYFGAGRVNATKAMMILTLIFPLVFRSDATKTSRWVYMMFLIGGLIFIFIGVKRSALFGLFIGYFIYSLFTPYKVRFIQAFAVIGLILVLFSPLYLDIAKERFEARQEEGRFDVSKAEEEESRVIELFTVRDAFIEGNIWYKLFGAELFNSPYFFQTGRMLHTDYATIFQGSGLTGLFLFLFIFYLIFRKSIRYLRFYKTAPKEKEILAVSLAVLAGVLITGISGTVIAIGLRSIAFLFWGASFSYLDHEYRRLRIQPKQTSENHNICHQVESQT